MILCPFCSTQNPPASNFCKQCGKPIAAHPVDATIAVTSLGTRAGPQKRDLELAKLFADKARLVIGRAPDCDLHLPHLSVSRYHARVERKPEGLFLEDLASVNGVWVNGRRISEATAVNEGDRVGIGPFLLSLSGGVLQQLDNSKSLRLEAHNLEKVVKLPGGCTRKILDDINLVVNPGEFVTLLGPSGCGKSTLMDALNGRRPATGGKVLANGEDFYTHFDNFRQSLGYVPQKDIVHSGLTVARALHYTAQLRLPIDSTPMEIDARVKHVMQEMELIPHRDTLIGNLSGGQIKRVSLGAELIAQPALLYIDEATSGLDAGTEARMMRLFRRLADGGRSVICITHNVDNVDQCHMVLVLARGKLMYYGPPTEAPRYFKVKRISDVYDRLAQREPAEWEQEFRQTSLYREYVADRLVQAKEEGTKEAEEKSKTEPPALPTPTGSINLLQHLPPLADRFRELSASVLRWRDRVALVGEVVHQFQVLTARYMELIFADRRGLRLLLMQAPIVALFLLLGFVLQPFRATMPILRPLNEDERETLMVVRATDLALKDEQSLTVQQKEALAKIKLTAGDLPPVNANSLLAMLRKLARDDLGEQQMQSLEQIHFTVDQDGRLVQVSALKMVRAWRTLQESNLADQLLKTPGSVVPDRTGTNPRFTYILLFIVVMCVLWFGCNNAAKEIVKEEAIYGRERAVNLHILPYLASKFLVLTLITVFHAFVLVFMVFGVMDVLAWWWPQVFSSPAVEHMLGYGPLMLVLSVLSMTGVSLGLLLSACVSSPDRANALLPYVLIPQMILGGGILTVNKGALFWLAALLSPVYWAYRAVHLGANRFSEDFPLWRGYEDGYAWPCAALAAQALVLLLATACFMKRKDAA